VTRPFLPVLALCACLVAGSTLAASSSADADLPSLNYDPDTGAFTEAPPPERGWQAFADLLKKATPSVNTAIPLTPTQIAEHVSSLIDSGRAKEALDIITKRQAAHDASVSPGIDVQLRYLQGRALDALGQHDQAMAVWRQMTTDYPELPEPWNALAIAYARQGQLQLAREALDMALVSDPSFAPALENLGHVQMRLAQESFDRARAAGGGQAPKPAQAPVPSIPKTPAPQAQ
jgi:tetratricopeptide (TPR) repeat protein